MGGGGGGGGGSAQSTEAFSNILMHKKKKSYHTVRFRANSVPHACKYMDHQTGSSCTLLLCGALLLACMTLCMNRTCVDVVVLSHH